MIDVWKKLLDAGMHTARDCRQYMAMSETALLPDKVYSTHCHRRLKKRKA